MEELEEIVWAKRKVFVIYDSDARTNSQVCAALNALAEELCKHGAIPYVVSLPEVVGEGKTGLDDFLVAMTPNDLRALLNDQAQPLTLARKLWQINDEVLYVHDPGLILVEETGQKISPSSFKEHAYAHADYAEQVLKADGNLSMKPISAAAVWLKWPLRKEVGSFTYAPGEDKYVHTEQSIRLSKYNVWPGWGTEPKKGSVSLFVKLIDHIFTGASPEAKQWFLRWCAYPLQHPGAKLYTSAVVYGINQGTGKSLIGYTLGRIYGDNFAEISQRDLHGSFTGWAENKQFIMGDDVTGSDKRQDADMLKKLITQKEFRINIKYLPEYSIPDCVNYYFSSNHPDAFFLEDDDRRFFIHEVVVDKLDDAFYDAYDVWFKGAGSAAVFDYLLNLDLGNFNPVAAALRTDARSRMIHDMKSDISEWVARLISDTDNVLRVGRATMSGDLFTSHDLLRVYDPEERHSVTANGLARELRRAGVPQACSGNSIKTKSGQKRLYILRNLDKWAGATSKQVSTYMNKQKEFATTG